MKKHNAENERIKRRYLVYLEEAESYSVATTDAVAMALERFEVYSKHRDFKKFHPDQAKAFKVHLSEQRNQRTREKLSKSTAYAILNHLKRFFHWLAREPGFKTRIQYSDANYFSPSKKDARVATARREPRVPTMAQIKHVISTMPAGTDIARRNRALIAFTLATGARDSAIASAKLKHVDLEAGCFNQDARDVRTKFSKSQVTTFFPVGPEILAIVVEWVTWLRTEKLWGNDDPLFPATHVAQGPSRQYEVIGLARKHWSNATPIRAIFRDAFTRAGLPYFNPHSVRNTLVQLSETMFPPLEQFKAWSQNLSHEHMLTTLLHYGEVSPRRQAEIMRDLAVPRSVAPPDVSLLAKAVADEILRSRR